MTMKKWNELPLDMQVEEVKKYYKTKSPYDFA